MLFTFFYSNPCNKTFQWTNYSFWYRKKSELPTYIYSTYLSLLNRAKVPFPHYVERNKLRCDTRFQRAFTTCSCVFKVITLVWANKCNYFENATACSKRKLKTTVATQLNKERKRRKILNRFQAYNCHELWNCRKTRL